MQQCVSRLFNYVILRNFQHTCRHVCIILSPAVADDSAPRVPIGGFTSFQLAFLRRLEPAFAQRAKREPLGNTKFVFAN